MPLLNLKIAHYTYYIMLLFIMMQIQVAATNSEKPAPVTINWHNEFEACYNMSPAIVMCQHESLSTMVDGRLKYSSSAVWTRNGENIRDDDSVYVVSNPGLTSATLTVYETPEGPVEIACYLPLNDGSGNIIESNKISIAVGLTKPQLPIVVSNTLDYNGSIVLTHNKVCFDNYKFHPEIIVNGNLLGGPNEFSVVIEIKLRNDTNYKIEIYAVCEVSSIRSSALTLFVNSGSVVNTPMQNGPGHNAAHDISLPIVVIGVNVVLALFWW